MEPIEILKPTNEFNAHLKLEANSRIIFSGRYGIGKTYFLRKFFESDNKNYFPIFLSPVNYSLASTEDIFNLIKYDVLGKIIDESKLSIKEPEFVTSNDALIEIGKKFAGSILKKLAPKISNGFEVLRQSENLGNEYRDLIAAGKPSAEEIELIKFEDKIGTHFLFEEDFITQKIRESLAKIFLDGKKETVLIIDDIDRLDAEHVFRLFNIFSAHLHVEDLTQNKFGFSKVVFVCDVENLKKMFACKYGEGVDFTGFIDKFYTHQIFIFENLEGVKKQVQKYFSTYERTFSVHRQDLTNFHAQLAFELIDLLWHNHKLNLRAIKKILSLDVSKWPAFSKLNRGYRIDPIMPIVELLSWIIGSQAEFIQYLHNVANNLERKVPKEKSYVFENVHAVVADCLLFAFPNDMKGKHSKVVLDTPCEYEISDKSRELQIKFVGAPPFDDRHVVWLLIKILE
jgi:hypothetical protein